MDLQARYEEKERREDVRWYEEFSADFIFFSDLKMPELPKKVQGTICNISALGVCIEIVIPEGINKEGLLLGMIKVGIKMNFSKKDREIKALTKVVWMNSYGESENRYMAGLEFININFADKEAIKEYIIDSYLAE